MTDAARSRDIARYWPRHWWDGEGRSRWAQWGWRHYLFILIFALLVSVSMVEKALSENGEKQPWPFFGWLAASPGGLVTLALLVLLNGWFIDRMLADRTLCENNLPRWLRGLRWIAGTVPILGLYIIPSWHWLIRRPTSSAFRSSTASRLELSSPRMAVQRTPPLRVRIDSLRRAQDQSLFPLILWLIAGQLAPWIAMLSWMTTVATLSPGRRAALEALSLLFRVLACAVAVQYGVLRGRQIRAQSNRRLILWFAPVLFLLPFPAFILGFLPWLLALGEEEETLVGRAWSRKSQSSPQALQARWPSRPAAFSTARESSDVMEARFAFHRLKIFLLFLEAGALAWVLTRSGRPLFSFRPFPVRQIAPYLTLAALGLIAEGIFLAQSLFGWFRRQKLSPLPYGRSVAFICLTLVGGLLFGSLLAIRKAAMAGQLLLVTGLGAVLLTALIFGSVNFLLAKSGQQNFVTFTWVILFFEIFATGAVMSTQPELAPRFVVFFTKALVLTPLWSLALFFGLGGWLLHPFRLKHLFDRRLPGSTRSVLAAVALTAALPLGGLAIPFWIYAQNRLWPRYELLLWNLDRKDDP
jgi:hypothetical protein